MLEIYISMHALHQMHSGLTDPLVIGDVWGSSPIASDALHAVKRYFLLGDEVSDLGNLCVVRRRKGIGPGFLQRLGDTRRT